MLCPRSPPNRASISGILISIGERSKATGHSVLNHSRFAFGSASWALSMPRHGLIVIPVLFPRFTPWLNIDDSADII